jgi:hypothetical protein
MWKAICASKPAGRSSRDHDIEVGCLVNFFYKGDGEMSVKMFNKESCHIHYHNDSGDDNDDDGSEE